MVFYKGKRFRIERGYFKRGNNYLHRIIWEERFGKIPKGFHIHHIDGNKTNNEISNLSCLSHSEHLSLHQKVSRARHVWHKSKEGRAFLGEKSKNTWKNRVKHELFCLNCVNKFFAKQIDRAKFCSNNCEQSARRKRGVDLVERTCVICKNPFKINKYYFTKTCGYSCGDRLRRKDFP